MSYIAVFITSLITTSFLFFKFFRPEQIGCYPYLDTVRKIEKEAMRNIFAGTYSPEIVDFQLRALNKKVKSSKKLLLDCKYVAISKNNNPN